MKDRQRGYANFLTATRRHTQVPEVTDAVSTKAWKTMQAPAEKEAELDSKTKRILAAE